MKGDKTSGMPSPEARAALLASPLQVMTGCQALMPAATELAAPRRQATHLASLQGHHQQRLPPDIHQCVPPTFFPSALAAVKTYTLPYDAANGGKGASWLDQSVGFDAGLTSCCACQLCSPAEAIILLFLEENVPLTSNSPEAALS